MRIVKNISLGWKYSETYEEAMNEIEYSDKFFEKVNLPHTNKKIPLNYFESNICGFVSCYRTHIHVPVLKDNLAILRFQGVMAYAEVYVGGQLVGTHKGGYAEFIFDITDFVVRGDNIVVVKVDSTERQDIPPFGNVLDYMTYGGIYREVFLEIMDKIHIDNVFLSNENKRGHYHLIAEVKLNKAADVRVKITISYKGEFIARKIVRVEGDFARIKMFSLPVELWDIENPILYDIDVKLYGASTDNYHTRHGFREAKFTTRGFFLNGKKINLRGLNRHQAYPYVGYAMPRNGQFKDAEILKEELGINIVRTSHYMQSTYFLDRCDELGLLVFEEIPGWQNIGDSEWKKVAIQNVKEMIMRDRNHPSIVLWGVRINESRDDHDFYTETNRVAHELDTTRQTGGVRCIKHSEFLEDVYTNNDFMVVDDVEPIRTMRNRTGLDYDVPYLVTEFMGHMYPTKSYDHDARLIKQATRHADICNFASGEHGMSGSIGWCAFDYNTHMQFGSGDKICYHGVMDMFRLPKYAAHFYASQIDPSKKIVLEPATMWARGDYDIGVLKNIPIFTNCDRVDMIVGSDNLKVTYYPSFDKYPNLTHPPIIIEEIDNVWGDQWQTVTFVGIIKGQVVIEKRLGGEVIPSQLEVKADCSEIPINDVTRVVVRALDNEGNVMRHFIEPIHIALKGGTLIGESLVSLRGGVSAFWVRSSKAETIDVKVTCPRFATVALRIIAK